MDNELLLFDRINVIKDTITKYGEENFYLSFSGGKDSTILHISKEDYEELINEEREKQLSAWFVLW